MHFKLLRQYSSLKKDGLYDVVHTYTRMICTMRSTHIHARFALLYVFFFVPHSIEKNNKTCFYFWFPSWQELKFQPSVCTIILVTLHNFGIVVWTQLKVSEHFLAFPIPLHVQRKPIWRSKCDNLQNRLDMTSHKSPLLGVVNERCFWLAALRLCLQSLVTSTSQSGIWSVVLRDPHLHRGLPVQIQLWGQHTLYHRWTWSGQSSWKIER